MSITKSVTVWCEEVLSSGETCMAWTAGAQERTAAEARRTAKANGWGRKEGRDLCPSCLAEKGGKP